MSQRKNKTPKGLKGQRRRLLDKTLVANAMAKKAMHEASLAIDNLLAENRSLRRVLIAERAQVIYYTGMALGYSKRAIVDPVLKGWMQLKEKEQEKFVKQAVLELSAPEDGGTVPHQSVVLTDAEETAKPKLVQ